MTGSDNLEHKEKMMKNLKGYELELHILKSGGKAIVKLQMKQPHYVRIKARCGIKTKALLHALLEAQ